jgi:hypothetical protein
MQAVAPLQNGAAAPFTILRRITSLSQAWQFLAARPVVTLGRTNVCAATYISNANAPFPRAYTILHSHISIQWRLVALLYAPHYASKPLIYMLDESLAL